jgi:hypothetical protein
MSQKSNPKLTVEMVPRTCHYSNVRTMVTPKQWDELRFATYDKAKHTCEICGDNGHNQGYKHRVECHEIWNYDDNTQTQKLTGLIALCPTCHQVKHIGRSKRIGKGYNCYKQLTKVNHWTKEMIDKHILDSQAEYRIRSKMQWKLDISILNEKPYELNLNLNKDRVFSPYIKPKVKKIDLMVQEALDRQTKLKLDFDAKNKKTSKKATKKVTKKVPKKAKSIASSHLQLILKEPSNTKGKKKAKKNKKTNRKPPKK